MASFKPVDAKHVAISALGALTLSALSVFAAAAPAKAEAPASLAAWNDMVAHRIAMLPQEDRRFQPSEVRTAGVTAHFDDNGGFTGASLAQSSGDRAIDRRAVQIAKGLAYPQLPAALRGQARDVTVRLQFGDGANVPPETIQTSPLQMARAAKPNVQIARR